MQWGGLESQVDSEMCDRNRYDSEMLNIGMSTVDKKNVVTSEQV